MIDLQTVAYVRLGTRDLETVVRLSLLWREQQERVPGRLEVALRAAPAVEVEPIATLEADLHGQLDGHAHARLTAMTGRYAAYIARERGLNVDQPRNLAKTVTVE